MIDPADRGFTLGDGLFETLAAQDGRLRDADLHLERLAAGCAALGLPVPDQAAAERTMLAALPPDCAGPWAVRLTLTAGSGGRGLDRPDDPEPVMVATAAPAPRPSTPARLLTATVRRNDASPASRLKTLSYLDNVLARREALASGADEAVMLNTRGQPACAAAANLFWISGGELFTPALQCGVLAGVTRAQLIAAARAQGVAVHEVAAEAAALAGAEAVLITNSLIGVRLVSSLDGRGLSANVLAGALARSLPHVG